MLGFYQQLGCSYIVSALNVASFNTILTNLSQVSGYLMVDGITCCHVKMACRGGN